MTQLAPSSAFTSQAVNADPSEAFKTIVLDVEGMMCAGCVSTVEKKLAQCEGVTTATVNLVTEVAAVTCGLQVDGQAIAQILTEAGYPSKVRFAHAQDGDPALAAEADWMSRQQAAQTDQISQLAVAALLLGLSTIGHLSHFRWAQGFFIPVLSTLWFHATLATLTLLLPARKILREGWQGARRGSPNMNTLVSLGALSAYVTSLVALLFPGLGWECFFDEPVMLLSFILLGRTLEQKARFQAAGALRSLIALQPTLARLVPAPTLGDDLAAVETAAENAGVQIPATQVQVGEWLRVLPSEKVPADGVIALGRTTLDESMLTGESMPVVKQPGDEVVAGSLNQSGAITLQVSRTGRETTLAKMIRLVEAAQARKAPIQRLADSISGYFTYGILTCAALTFGFWYFVGVPLWPEAATAALGHVHRMAGAMPVQMAADMTADMTANITMQMSTQMAAMPMAAGMTPALRLLVSLKLAIAVVVVACPCALGLATPTAILVGSGMGAQQGLLIRGGDILEAICGLDTLVFDKTGTLTTGMPELMDCHSLVPAISTDQLLQLAATVESGTRHPVGLAIQRAAIAKNLTLLSASDFQTLAGCGVSAQIETEPGNRLTGYVGNWTWMNKNGCVLEAAPRQLAQSLGESGKTAVFVAQNQTIVGVIAVADTLRAEASQTVEKLRSLGLSVQLISGDSAAAANAIAQQLGFTADQVKAEISPQGKVDAIATLQKLGHLVGFIGDGINDAPALAQADVGIALNSGTDIAMETADVVLMRDDLNDVLAAIDLSRATFNKIRQNLIWAFAYNLFCIPLAAGAFLPALSLSLTPGFAGGLMALSSVTVVLNSLLLKARF